MSTPDHQNALPRALTGYRSVWVFLLFWVALQARAALVGFSIDGLPASVTAGQQVQVQVHGVGAAGERVPLGSAPAELRATAPGIAPTVLLTEWSSLPGVEMMNVSDHSQSLAGWRLLFFSSTNLLFRDPAPGLMFSFPPGSQCAPGQVLTLWAPLPGRAKPDFILSLPSWTSQDLALLTLVDDAGLTRDVYVPQPGLLRSWPWPAWLSPADWVDVPAEHRRYDASRTGSVDHNDPTDWAPVPSSLGSTNAGLRLPFPALEVEKRLSIDSAVLVGGSWHATLRFMDSGSGVRLRASSLIGADGASPPVTVVEAPPLQIVLPDSLIEGSSAIASVRMSSPPSADLAVHLRNGSDDAHLKLPGMVVIRANTSSVDFEITAVENSLIEGTQRIAVVAESDAVNRGSGVLTLKDNDLPRLTISLPPSMDESPQPYTTSATIQLDRPVDRQMVVVFESSLPSQVAVTPSAVIPQGSRAASFGVTVTPDAHPSGDRTVTLQATLPDLASASSTFVLVDRVRDRLQWVQLSSPIVDSFFERAAPYLSTLKLQTDLSQATDLRITLTSNSPEHLVLPDSVIMPAGSNSVYVPLTCVDDGLTNAMRWISVTASAAGYEASTSSIPVLDNHLAGASVWVEPQPSLGSDGMDVTATTHTIDFMGLGYEGSVTLQLVSAAGVPVAGSSVAAVFGQGIASVRLPAPQRTVRGGWVEAVVDNVVVGRSDPLDWIHGWQPPLTALAHAWDSKRNQTLVVGQFAASPSVTHLVGYDSPTGDELWRLEIDGPSGPRAAVAISSDSSFLYAASSAAGGIIRVDLASRAVDRRFASKPGDPAGSFALDLAVVPGSATRLMVVRGDAAGTPLDAALLQDGLALPQVIASPQGDGGLAYAWFDDDGVYGYLSFASAFHRVVVGPGGLAEPAAPPGVADPARFANEGRPVSDGQFLYLQGRWPLDRETLASNTGNWGNPPSFSNLAGLLAVDPRLGKIFRVVSSGSGLFVSIVERGTLVELSQVPVPGASLSRGMPSELRTMGPGMIGFLQPGLLSVVQTDPIPPLPPAVVWGVTAPASLTNAVQSEFHYSIGLTNQGVTAAEGLFLLDRLPSGLALGSALSSQGSAVVSNGLLRWVPGRLEPGGIAHLDLSVAGPSPGIQVSDLALHGAQTPYSPGYWRLTNWVEATGPLPSVVGYPALYGGEYDSVRDRYWMRRSSYAPPMAFDFRTGIWSSLRPAPTNASYQFHIAPGGDLLYLLAGTNSILRYDLATEAFLAPIQITGATIRGFQPWKGHRDTLAILWLDASAFPRLGVYVDGTLRGGTSGSPLMDSPISTFGTVEWPVFWSDDGTRIYRYGTYGGPDVGLMTHEVTPAAVKPPVGFNSIPGLATSDPLYYVGDRFFSLSGLTFSARDPARVTQIPIVTQYSGAGVDPITGEMQYILRDWDGNEVISIDPVNLGIRATGRLPIAPSGFRFYGPIAVSTPSRLVVGSAFEALPMLSMTPSPIQPDSGHNGQIGLFQGDPERNQGVTLAMAYGQQGYLFCLVTNAGTTPVELISLTGTLPDGLSVADNPPEVRDFSGYLYAPWVLGGGHTDVGIPLRADRAGDYRFPARLAWRDYGGRSGTNTVECFVRVSPPQIVDLHLLPISIPTVGEVGTTLHFTVTITNASDMDAHEIDVGLTTAAAITSERLGLSFGNDPPLSLDLDAPGFTSGALFSLSAHGQMSIKIDCEPQVAGVFRFFTLQVRGALEAFSSSPDTLLNVEVDVRARSFSRPVGRLVLAASDMVSWPASNRLVLASASPAGRYHDHLILLDPASGEFSPWLPVPAPYALGISPGGTSLFVASTVPSQVTRISLADSRVDAVIPITDDAGAACVPIAVVGLPGSAGAFAVIVDYVADQQKQLRVYDGATPRSLSANLGNGNVERGALAVDASSDSLFVIAGGRLRRFTVTGGGVVEDPGFPDTSTEGIAVDGLMNRVVTSEGRVLDGHTGVVARDLGAFGLPVLDVESGLLLTLSGRTPKGTLGLAAFDRTRIQRLWSVDTGIFAVSPRRVTALPGGLIAQLGLIPPMAWDTEVRELLILDPGGLAGNPAAPLRLSLSAASGPRVHVGLFLTNTWVLQNQGPWSSTNVVVSNSLPDGLIVLSTTSTRGTVEASPGGAIVRVPVLEPLEQVTIVQNLQATASGSFSFLTRAWGDPGEGESTDNAVLDSIDINPMPILYTPPRTVVVGPGLPFTDPFSIQLSAPSPAPVRFQLSTADGTAKANVDYVPISRVVLIPAGAREVFVPIQVLPNRLAPGDVSFSLQISSATNALPYSALIPWTIQNRPPSLSVTGGVAGEAAVAGDGCDFTFSIPAASGRAVRVGFRAVSGTATAGTDFVPVEGTIVIPAGATNAVIHVPMLDDTIEERDETVGLSVTSIKGAFAPGADAVGMILDDDGAHQIVITSITPQPLSKRVAIAFNAAYGAYYSLQRTDALEVSPWVTPAALPTRATGPSLVLTDTLPTQPAASRYYRVVRVR